MLKLISESDSAFREGEARAGLFQNDEIQNSICHLPISRAASRDDLQAVQGFDVARTLSSLLAMCTRTNF
jgi:hypothetical protein